MNQYVNKTVSSLDELYEVMSNAYRSSVILFYCLKCLKLFSTNEERLEHDDVHGKDDKCMICEMNNITDSVTNEVLRKKCDECLIIAQNKTRKMYKHFESDGSSSSLSKNNNSFVQNMKSLYKCTVCQMSFKQKRNM